MFLVEWIIVFRLLLFIFLRIVQLGVYEECKTDSDFGP
jgi:hypothetical protein